MKMHYIFYTVGVLFIFASVIYFAREFIQDLPNEIKLFSLVVATILIFSLAEVFRGRNM